MPLLLKMMFNQRYIVKNLITELELRLENHFYCSLTSTIRSFVYDQADMKLSKYASVEHIKDEDEATAYQALQEYIKVRSN